jgi:hypothetical protein
MTLNPTKSPYIYSAIWACAFLLFSSILPIWVEKPNPKFQSRNTFYGMMKDADSENRPGLKAELVRCLPIAFVVATIGAILGRVNYWVRFEKKRDEMK